MIYEKDFLNFCKAWKMAYLAIGQKEPSNDVLEGIFDILKELPMSYVLDGIQHHVATSEFVVKPANIFAYAKKRVGMTADQLKNNAYIFFDKYLQNINGDDAVIDDWRMASAFFECFRSVNDYLYRPNSDYAVGRDRELFATTVVNTLSQFNKGDSTPLVFAGRRNLRNTIRVKFFGDFKNCKAIAENFYKKPEFFGFAIEMPIDPSLRLENKTQTNTEISEQQKAENKKYLNELISILSPMQ